MPKVLNKRFDVIPPGAIYCGRPSKWGNRFRIGQTYRGVVLDRQGAIAAHKDWLLNTEEGQALLADIGELRGADLVCWCAPLPCHCDLYLELANKDM